MYRTSAGKVLFHPNSTYILATAEERSKLIFPEGWDLSETKVLPGLPDASAMIPEGQNENRLYGDSWLLMEIAKATGVFEDLCSVFRDNINYVNIILTIAFFHKKYLIFYQIKNI